MINMDTISRSKHFTSKKRRRRTIINSKDLEKLESVFKTSKWPEKSQKERLSKAIGKSENCISTWFQNRRARMRRLARQTDLLDEVDVISTKDTLSRTGETTDSSNPTRTSQRRLHKYKSYVYTKPTKVHLHEKSKATKTSYQGSLTEVCQKVHEVSSEEYDPNDSMTEMTDKNGSDDDFNQMKNMKIRNKINTCIKMKKGPDDVIPSERRVFIETPSPNDSTAWDNIFRRIVDMMAASESVMSKTDTAFPFAIKDAALGIRLKDGMMNYNKTYGLDFEDDD